MHLRADVGRFAYGRPVAASLCMLGYGPAWDDAHGIRGRPGWDKHAQSMDGLVDDGFIVVGGPVGRGAPLPIWLKPPTSRRSEIG